MENTSHGKVTRLLVLAVFIAAPLAVGFAGSLLTSDNIDGWYAVADRAPWTPPNFVFGPVWTVLYLLIGGAGWLIWLRPSSEQRRRAFYLYATQLVLNAAWTPLFFGAYPIYGNVALWGAFIVIALLLLTVLLAMRVFAPLNRSAAWFFLPYALWVGYASTLNLYMALNN